MSAERRQVYGSRWFHGVLKIVPLVILMMLASLMPESMPAFGPPPNAGGLNAGGLLENKLSGKCIDVAGSPGTANGAWLQLWDCEFGSPSTTDQRWTFTSDGFIQNVLSGRCIDVLGSHGTANGTRLQLYDCDFGNPSTTDQRWTFIATTYSVSGRVADGSNVGIAGVTISGGPGHTATTDGNGNYTMSGLTGGAYTLVPSEAGYVFSPPSRAVSGPPDATGQDFTAIAASAWCYVPVVLR